MNRDAHDLLIEAEAEKDFGDIGSQGNDSLRRKRESHFSSHFIFKSSGGRKRH
jgi:hypothetical protein